MLDMRGEFIGRGLLETGGDLLQQGRLIGLDRQEIVAAAGADRGRHRRIAGDRVDRHQRPVEGERIEQVGDRGTLVFFLVHRLLCQHQALAGGPGRDQMQGAAAARAVLRAARGLAVDRDEIGSVRPQTPRPVGKAGLKQLRIDPVHHHPQPVLAGHPDRAPRQGTPK
jgi:hypothetical protein